MPTRKRPIASRMVATGRSMKGVEMLKARARATGYSAGLATGAGSRPERPRIRSISR
ncbi:hypothetical protein STVA_13440 [Allostella vacuolata]|nr:hypothetical protein STVA_13440 [Stella vacuolata]